MQEYSCILYSDSETRLKFRRYLPCVKRRGSGQHGLPPWDIPKETVLLSNSKMRGFMCGSPAKNRSFIFLHRTKTDRYICPGIWTLFMPSVKFIICKNTSSSFHLPSFLNLSVTVQCRHNYRFAEWWLMSSYSNCYYNSRTGLCQPSKNYNYCVMAILL